MPGMASIPRPLAPVLKDLQAVARILWERGWAEKSAGNASADVTGLLPRTAPRGGRLVLATGAGVRFRDLARDPRCGCVLLLEAGGRVRPLAGRKGLAPTSELPTHLRLHAVNRKAGWPERAVLHTHPDEILALTHLPEYCDEAALNRALWSMLPEVKMYVPEGCAFVPYAPSGSEALGKATAAALARGRRVSVWEKHGVTACGRDFAEAFDLVDALNKAARVHLLALATGKGPAGLSPEALEQIERDFPPRRRP